MNTQALQLYTSSLPGSSLEAYIAHVNQIPMLTQEEEKEFSEKLYYNNDLEAARRLIMSHLRYVVRIAKGYTGYGLSLGDLIQEGNVGLMKAVKRFDPTMGVRLVSFAVHWIKAEIHEFILKNWRIVKVATTKAQRKLFFNLRKFKKRLGWFSEQEIQDVANDLGVGTRVVREMEERLNAHDPSFDPGPDVQESSEDHIAFAPSHYLEDHSQNPEHLLETDTTEMDQKTRLHTAMQTLDARSQEIIQYRWLNEKKKTLHELAALYHVSAERIRQLEQAAFKKVRHAMAAN